MLDSIIILIVIIIVSVLGAIGSIGNKIHEPAERTKKGILCAIPSHKSSKSVSFAPIRDERIFNKKGKIIRTVTKQV